jgi:hypothetical protein
VRVCTYSCTYTGDGKLSFDEFSHGLHSLGVVLPQKEIEAIWSEVCVFVCVKTYSPLSLSPTPKSQQEMAGRQWKDMEHRHTRYATL